jgi:hypothetical protein
VRFLTTLLASVSIVALIAVSSPAAAGEAGSGFTFEATSAYLSGPNTVASKASLGTSNVTPLTGYYAGVKVGKDVMPMWDVTGRFAVTRVIDSGSDKLGIVSNSLSFQTLDLEAGYTPKLTNVGVRFFAGLRGLHYTNSLTRTFSGSNFFFLVNPSSDFYGIGPRIGLEVEKQFDGSAFGISAEAAGAVIVGSANTTTTEDKLGTVSSMSSSVAKTVIDLEASAGVDYHFNDLSKVTLGYRAEALSDVNSEVLFGGQGSSGSDSTQLVSGPFLKLKIGL